MSRYYIIKSRELYLVYEGLNLIAYYDNLKEAELKIQKMEFIDLIYLLMND
jgi:hypothetical protein